MVDHDTEVKKSKKESDNLKMINQPESAEMITPDPLSSLLVTNDSYEEGNTTEKGNTRATLSSSPDVTTPSSNVEDKIHLVLKSCSVTLFEVADEDDLANIGGGDSEVDGDDDVQFQESIEEEHPGSSGYIAVK